MEKTNFWTRANRLGVFLLFLFILCFIWYYLMPSGRTLHEQLLKFTLFGFSGMNLASFILAAIQSYLWGYIFLVLWNLSDSITIKK